MAKATKPFVVGISQIDAALAGLDDKVKKQLFRKTLRRLASDVQKDAKLHAPQRTSTREAKRRGKANLKQSIKVKAMKRSRRRIGYDVKAERFYSTFVELGTKHISPNPFLRRARLKGERNSIPMALQHLAELMQKLNKSG